MPSTQVLLGVLVPVAALIIYAGSRYWRYTKSFLGSLDVSTASVAYHHNRTLTWNKHSLLIDGKPVLLISGEFHYWRLPDRERWRDILIKYKAAGLNCIRIYFNWGYHSPRTHYQMIIFYLITS